MPIRRIARRLGIARNAVRRWLRAGEAPINRRAPGSSAPDRHLGYVERHLGYVERRWAEGCHNSAQLWYGIVRRWAELLASLRRFGPPLSQPWCNGPVEGQINRLKLLKRQAYGRAEFDLPRSRVLHAA
jgi:hypothetical protein